MFHKLNWFNPKTIIPGNPEYDMIAYVCRKDKFGDKDTLPSIIPIEYDPSNQKWYSKECIEYNSTELVAWAYYFQPKPPKPEEILSRYD